MIMRFAESWTLFHNTYLVGWLIGVALSLVGVVAVARDQIFLGAAVSQASTLGIALAMFGAVKLAAFGFGWLESDFVLSAAAVVFSVGAAIFAGGGGDERGESHEAIAGWVFLLSASVSILIVSHSPHGLDEIHRLLSSSLIGATDADVIVFGVLTVLVALAIARLRRRLLLFATDAPMAAALGMHVRRWSLATAAALGLTIGLAIRSSGLLFTFGSLVLPPLIAKNLCRRMESMFVVAAAASLTAGVAGFMIANQGDYPPAQMTVAILAALLAGAWALRALQVRRDRQERGVTADAVAPATGKPARGPHSERGALTTPRRPAPRTRA
ncbi:metal ABC transporter permease [bacterium]|nr:metal ABC transporter permease [bacterium]